MEHLYEKAAASAAWLQEMAIEPYAPSEEK